MWLFCFGWQEDWIQIAAQLSSPFVFPSRCVPDSDMMSSGNIQKLRQPADGSCLTNVLFTAFERLILNNIFKIFWWVLLLFFYLYHIISTFLFSFICNYKVNIIWLSPSPFILTIPSSTSAHPPSPHSHHTDVHDFLFFFLF